MSPIEFRERSLLLSENKRHHIATLHILHSALRALTSAHQQNLLEINQKCPAALRHLFAARATAKYERLQKELRRELTAAQLAYTERRADLLQQPANMSREFIANRKTRMVIFNFSGLRARLAEVEEKNSKLRKDKLKCEEAHGGLLLSNQEMQDALGKEKKKKKKYRAEARASAAELRRFCGTLADANSKLIAQSRLVELIGKKLVSELAAARGESGKLERVEKVLAEVKLRAGGEGKRITSLRI